MNQTEINDIDFEAQVQAKCKDMSPREFKKYLLGLQLEIMDMIIEKKMEQGYNCFSEVEDGLLN